MKEKLQEYALIAEILGAVAIVISLLFVGFQITDGNREARAATTQSVLDSEMFFLAELIRNADVWEKVILNGDISEKVETRKAIALFNMMLTQNDNLFQMQKAGYVEYEEISLGAFADPSFINVWRQSPGANSLSPEFLEIVNAQLVREEIQ